MFSGFLQAAAYTNLSGRFGLPGWRWLFIIDAIITIPIALFGYFFLPGLPLQDSKEWWLSHEQNELAKARLNHIGRKGRTPWTWAKVRRLFSTWHIYVLRTLLSSVADMSLPLRVLEQRLCPAADGLLPQELQQEALPRAGASLLRGTDQQL
jgi:MFS family permease